MNLLPLERSILYPTYLEIAAAGAELTTQFYARLFELNPPLQALFKSPMRDQGIKWRMMLNVILSAIDQPTRLKSSLRELGQRHVEYGVKPQDYSVFIDSVLWAFQQYLGDRYTPEVDAAWRKLFDFIVEQSTSA